ncbi:uncharacterized protein MICPUCDRAFT_5836, partial [Micromonas pusilla CCMP1545]
TPDGRATFKALAWNVAGLRALMEKNPGTLRAIVDAERPDVLCLQEHKLQDVHVSDLTTKLKTLLPEYPTVRFAVSTKKKGYSGVALLGVVEGLGGNGHAIGKHVDEGRLLTMEYETHWLVLAYVPNSGASLSSHRFPYDRVRWEADVRAYLTSLCASKPVVFGGDLNVAHLDADIYNVGAPHVKKSAGTTPEERAAFGELLATAGTPPGMSDTHFHPDATGWFTYWSQRVGNRPVNRGLRLDYFVASNDIL